MARFASVFLFVFLVTLPGGSGGPRCAAADKQPIEHVVLYKFKPDAPPEAVEALLAEFPRLPSKIPGFTGFQWGTNTSPEGLDKGYTHGFLTTFESDEALASYQKNPLHEEMRSRARPLMESVFVFDFPRPGTAGQGERRAPPAEPGRVHHLVFFKYKESASDGARKKVEQDFAALERKIPGLLAYESGRHAGPDTRNQGFTDGFILTFINHDARDDYLYHPEHKAFAGALGPVLEDVLVLDFTVGPSSRHLLVTGGLEPYQVVQQEGGKANLQLRGIAGGRGPIDARLLSGRRVVEGFDWRPAGKAERGAFEAQLEGVPAGGEYTIELRRRDDLGNVAEVADVAHVLVGDVWILAGQSNMEGVGDLADVEKPSVRVHCFSMADRWELAAEPLHSLFDSRDPVHLGTRYQGLDEAERQARRAADRRNRRKGAGLGLAFAKELVKRTGVPVGLIASAHGGTSLTQWDPGLKSKGGESLYGSMLKQARRAGGKVRGVLWYQGEAEANAEAAPLYRERFQKLAAAFREDFQNPRLPVLTVQLGRFVTEGPNAVHWSAVRETQRKIAGEIPGTAVVTAVDFALDDGIHVGTQDLKRLGARLAGAALRMAHGKDRPAPGPDAVEAVLEGDGRVLRVKFAGVNGRLSARGQVNGFSIRKADGTEVPLIYNAAVDPSQPSSVVLKLNGKPPAGLSLWYGYGFNPTCNLTDGAGLGALAFGPMEIR